MQRQGFLKTSQCSMPKVKWWSTFSFVGKIAITGKLQEKIKRESNENVASGRNEERL